MKIMLNSIVTKLLADINYEGNPTVDFYEEGCSIKFSDHKKSRFAIFISLVKNKKVCVKIINYWIEDYLIKNNLNLTNNGNVYFTILDELTDVRYTAKYWELVRVISDLDHYKCWKVFLNKKKYYWWNYISDWFKYR